MTCELPVWVSRRYGKAHGVFTPSGALAVESALLLLRPQRDSIVMLPRNACWKVGHAVRRLGLRPAFLDVAADCVIGPQHAADLSDRAQQLFADTSAFVAVHQFGLPTAVQQLRAALPPHIALIEDAAQTTGTRGVGADLVVTSFGPRKPVSHGTGGALFFDDPRALARFDQSRPAVLHRSDDRIPFGVPAAADEALRRAVDRSHETLAENIRAVAAMRELAAGLPGSRLLTGPEGRYLHRVPLLYEDDEALDALARTASTNGMVVQRPMITTQEQVDAWPGAAIIRLEGTDDGHVLLLDPTRSTERSIRTTAASLPPSLVRA